MLKRGGNANKTNEMRWSFNDTSTMEITWLGTWTASCGSSAAAFEEPYEPRIGAISPERVDHPDDEPMVSVEEATEINDMHPNNK